MKLVHPAAQTPDLAAPFHLSQLSLGDGDWVSYQERTLTYAKWIDLDRILYVFRENHGLDTQGAEPNGGWDAPDFPFRSHFQGHFLTAWAHFYAVLDDDECRDRAAYVVEELAKCQANNEAVGFTPGYLSGFPESEIEKVENRTLDNGNVPYYAIHKTMAGLLDVYQHMGNQQALDVLLGITDWIDVCTSRLSHDEMQESLETEFGGMNEIFADMARRLPDEDTELFIALARRFDHERLFDPLSAGRDELEGLHANTQIPKWIGAALEYKATGEERYLEIARNAWRMTVWAHSYAIGANSVAEHFRAPDAIVDFLHDDAAEACNSYNMLKLTRELWTLTPGDTEYFDFYEVAMLNHLIGQQDPTSEHGHVTYFTPLNPGGRRGVGPAWGGGTFSTDHDSFWCCQGTALETNTKLMDSIYFHDEESLYVNLFVASRLDWSQRGVQVSQTTRYPVDDTTTLTFERGASQFVLRVRIPAWAEDSEITVNGQRVNGTFEGGSYAVVDRRWEDGDVVSVRLPMSLRLIPANDDPNVASVAFGPTILAGNYGDEELAERPSLDLGSIRRLDSGHTDLQFEGSASTGSVLLGAFNAAQGFNYNAYWNVTGELP
ncbi:DUF1680-domain-containing protein [Sodiomyces alkalinus F11]|uniref:DUF1680-domain-containing protein n=1 Tax=Sodiomyces alkalinus (strain CBS 110278 / VKM F-3762 / F11) TaxID=1314773 RepID=A0A3N2PNT4_SODAK|nr:DUF1680-domain-containing protein [Sodiomyces alkalinus F11]ROT36177.1 DUF1680-domain-containing protein [Sodiomyces alkalinus F11]